MFVVGSEVETSLAPPSAYKEGVLDNSGNTETEQILQSKYIKCALVNSKFQHDVGSLTLNYICNFEILF